MAIRRRFTLVYRGVIARWLLLLSWVSIAMGASVSGRVLDPQGRSVSGATVRVRDLTAATDEEGRFILALEAGHYRVTIEAPGFGPAVRDLAVPIEGEWKVTLEAVAGEHQSVTVSARELQNSEVFERTLFTRDDQLIQQLDSGIDAGQHEGGGKSLEIRRFGFNLDHGGVNGGLKVMVDDVQQNQGTQGHG